VCGAGFGIRFAVNFPERNGFQRCPADVIRIVDNFF
jgi:hypothetical protein